MRLQRLLPRLQHHPAVHAVVDGGASVSAITPARPYALAALHAALARPLLLLETDALPYDRLPNDADKLADRLAVLQRLAGLDPDAKSPPLVVASVRAAIDLLVEPETFRAAHRTIRRGDSLPPAELAAEWLRLGFEPSPVVDQPGLFSRRGGILDVFPPGGYPVRIELWGDEVDTIRAFDPPTQRSTEQLDEARVGPAHEVLPCRLPQLNLELRGLRPQFAVPCARDLGIL